MEKKRDTSRVGSERARAARLLPVVAGALAACGGAPRPEAGLPPDVLLIVADDVGARDVHTIPTPALDRLAGRGVTFTRVWSNMLCSPSRHTIQFGRYAGRDGIGGMIVPTGFKGIADQRNPDSPLENLSLAELVAPLGYHTAHFGKWNLSNDTCGSELDGPRLHGYDTARAVTAHNLPRSYDDWPRIDDGERRRETTYATRAQADAFLEWVARTPSPWFASLSFNAPHSPLHVPPAELLPEGYAVRGAPRDKYEAMIVSLDTVIGELLDAVDPERTVVLFASDNGTSTPAPRVAPQRVKGSQYEGGIHVPLIVAGPGVDARGERSAALVSTVDLLATLADLTGAPIQLGPPGSSGPRGPRGPRASALDSVSFAQSLRDPLGPGRRRYLFSEHFGPNGGGPRHVERYAVRDARYKLMVEDPDGVGPLPATERLFDLARDPRELSPLDVRKPGSEASAALAGLRAHLEEVLAETRDGGGG